MPILTNEHFPDVVDRQSLDLMLSTGFGVSGHHGTPEFALSMAEALDHAGSDIYLDYEQDAEVTGYAETAAFHANICRLQTAADFAAAMLRTLAVNPDLLETVSKAMEPAGRKAA